MTILEIKEYAEKCCITLPETDMTKEALIEKVVTTSLLRFYGYCRNMNIKTQRSDIEEAAKGFFLEYDDIESLYNEAVVLYNKPKKKQEIKDKIGLVLLFILMCVIIGSILVCCGFFENSGSSKWSQLTPEEQDNARFAYEAQQAADDYRRDHPGR